MSSSIARKVSISSMEVLGIIFWLVVLNADVAFMCKIPTVVREIETAIDARKARRRAGTRARG